MPRSLLALIPTLLALLAGCAAPPSPAVSSTGAAPSAVVVSTGQGADAAFSAARSALVRDGYRVASEDPRERRLQTVPRTVGGVTVRLSATVRSSGEVVLQGTYGRRAPQPIRDEGRTGSAAQQAWNELSRVGQLLPGRVRTDGAGNRP
jgi:hypothetical protein